MTEDEGGAPAQRSATRIHSSVPRITAIAVPALAAAALLVGGRHLAEELLLWGIAVLLLVAVAGLLAYVLKTGQFPRRMPKDAVELPGDEVEDAGKSLDLVQKTLVEIVDRVERIERRLDLELQDDESDDAAMAEDAGGDAEGEAT